MTVKDNSVNDNNILDYVYDLQITLENVPVHLVDGLNPNGNYNFNKSKKYETWLLIIYN